MRNITLKTPFDNMVNLIFYMHLIDVYNLLPRNYYINLLGKLLEWTFLDLILLWYCH